MYGHRIGAVLHAPEGATGATGGGPPAKQLTEEDIGRIANSAITSQLKRLNIEGKIAEAIGGLKLDEKFEQLTQSLTKPPDKPKGDDDETAKKIKQLTDTVEAERKARLDAERAREEAEEQHRFDGAKQALAGALKQHANPQLHDVWVDHLVNGKRLKLDNGQPLLEVEYAPVKGMPKQKEFLPLGDAVQHLIATDDAKRFMAAPAPVQGQGPPGPRGVQAGPSRIDSKDPADRVYARLKELGLDPEVEFGS